MELGDRLRVAFDWEMSRMAKRWHSGDRRSRELSYHRTGAKGEKEAEEKWRLDGLLNEVKEEYFRVM